MKNIIPEKKVKIKSFRCSLCKEKITSCDLCKTMFCKGTDLMCEAGLYHTHKSIFEEAKVI